MDGFGDSDPEIEQAEAGDEATHCAALHEVRNVRVVEEKAVEGPDMGPRQKNENEADIKTDDDAQKEVSTAQPVGGVLRRNRSCGRAGGRRRRSGRNNVGRMRHKAARSAGTRADAPITT
jgi:hypothetical protein